MNRLSTYLLAAVLCALAACATAPVPQPQPAAPPVEHRDILVLNSGEEQIGELVAIDEGTVRFDPADAAAATWDKSQIERIDLGLSRPGDDWRVAADIADPELRTALQLLPTLDAFPEAGFVDVLCSVRMELAASGEVTRTFRTIRHILRERGRDGALVRFAYFAGDRVRIDHARTVTAAGEVLALTDAAVEDAAVNSRYPTHNRMRQQKFAMRGGDEGSTLDFQYSITSPPSSLTQPVWLQYVLMSEQPCQRFELVLQFPEGAMNYHADDPFGLLRMVETTDNGTTVVTGTANDLPAITWEGYRPPSDRLSPVVSVAPAAAWADLSASYQALLDGLAPAPADSPLAAAASAPDWEAARRTAVVMAQRFFEVPVSVVENGYLPQSPAETANALRGNELDLTVALCRALQTAGHDAALVLAATRQFCQVPPSVPSLGYFDRAGVRVRTSDGDRYLFLDGDRVRPDALPSSVQGAAALVAGEGALSQIPFRALGEDGQVIQFSSELTMDGSLSGTCVYQPGELEYTVRALKDLSEDQRLVRVQGLLSSLEPRAVLSGYTATDLKDLLVPVSIEMRFTINGYAIPAGSAYHLLPFPGTNVRLGGVGIEERKYPLFWDSPISVTLISEVRSPAALRLLHLPAGREIRNEIASLQSTVTGAARSATMTMRYQRSAVDAPASAFQDFQQVIEARNALSDDLIVLAAAE